MSEWKLVDGCSLHIISGWKLTEGCRSRSVGCSCCGTHFHRCMMGDDMWVLENKYGEKKRILCSYCYRNRDYNCDCHYPPPSEGKAPVEVDRVTGSRKVIDGCLNCYYHCYPCGQCKGKEELMSYAEFRKSSNRDDELPEKYEDFLSDKEIPEPERCV